MALSLQDFLDSPSSKKIIINEIDTPLSGFVWINHKGPVWKTTITPGVNLVVDDRGNTGYWKNATDIYRNIQSFNANGVLYTELNSIAEVEAQTRSWYYDPITTRLYVHFDESRIPEAFTIKAPGAAIGFTDKTDLVAKNYFESVYYEPLIRSVPSLSKKKDFLYYGILRYGGGVITYDNESGFFDKFAERDLYNQPFRLKLSFEGLPYAEALDVYNGRVGSLTNDDFKFQIRIKDPRDQLSRSLPVNEFNTDDYPSVDPDLVGTPIPIAFGNQTKAPAYRVAAGSWVFFDNEFFDVDSGITVYKEDGTIFAHSGTGVDGTFTGTDTTEELTVSYSVSSNKNTLLAIELTLDYYEGVVFSSATYDTTEWEFEKNRARSFSLWIGKGNIIKTNKLIEKACVINQGIFDILGDGRFTFRKSDDSREAFAEIMDDELIAPWPKRDYEIDEYLSSVRVDYGKNLLDGKTLLYRNTEFQELVKGRYGQYNEKPFELDMDDFDEVKAMTDDVMEFSQFIFPRLKISTKIQHVQARILDNVIYEYKRRNGNIYIPRALWEVLSITINLTALELRFGVRFISETIPEPEDSGVNTGAVYGLDVYGVDSYGV